MPIPEASIEMWVKPSPPGEEIASSVLILRCWAKIRRVIPPNNSLLGHYQIAVALEVLAPQC
jgi:hypothetical protein